MRNEPSSSSSYSSSPFFRFCISLISPFSSNSLVAQSSCFAARLHMPSAGLPSESPTLLMHSLADQRRSTALPRQFLRPVSPPARTWPAGVAVVCSSIQELVFCALEDFGGSAQPPNRRRRRQLHFSHSPSSFLFFSSHLSRLSLALV